MCSSDLAAGGEAASSATDHIARPHRWQTALEADRDTVGRLGALQHPVAEPDLDAVESVQPAEQFGVDHRLHEPVAFGPAESRVGRGHLDEQVPLRVEEARSEEHTSELQSQ